MTSKIFGLAFGLLLWNAHQHLAWSATDKTIVDLETSRPFSSARYHRPRGAQSYTYDKTEIDLAQPRSPSQTTTSPQEINQSTPRPALETAPQGPASTVPLPGGGR